MISSRTKIFTVIVSDRGASRREAYPCYAERLQELQSQPSDRYPSLKGGAAPSIRNDIV
ncbi:hypothetical protein GTQ43_23885 [Nostoc sp. KVJ3]|uniref:hypothetical protein n=1 Tax=Nostoc sp. KVJ3 TaxID=457945 RepID=UPI002237BF81|nr:hypothetical protein [Nostoc sp. KVJ3]MCW5316744.1 hypothetical protein [Nostoc sp. KVJ3]